jgi:hypothetical protein
MKKIQQYLSKINRSTRKATKKREQVRKGNAKYGHEVMMLAQELVTSKNATNLDEALDIIAKAGIYKQGGILKADGGLKLPSGVNLLNDDYYVGWDEYFNLDN